MIGRNVTFHRTAQAALHAHAGGLRQAGHDERTERHVSSNGWRVLNVGEAVPVPGWPPRLA